MILLALTLVLQQRPAEPPLQPPVLEFPEAGLDDPAAYPGYRTRLLRDARGNTVQVYLNAREGRVVTLWANAANESAGFTARDGAGRPATLQWGSPGARAWEAGGTQAIEYELTAPGPVLDVGLVQLGSMRWERDFQYGEGHLGPLDTPVYQPVELVRLLENLERLDPGERRRHLELLRAADARELRARLQPTLHLVHTDSTWILRATRPSFDGRNRMALELSGRTDGSSAELQGRGLRVRALAGAPLRLRVRVETDARPLTPLTREQLFHPDFLRWYREQRERGARTATDSLRLRRMERQLRGVELLSSREKLMAGLPNYATYFGRDMQMAALMMQGVWSDDLLESVVGSVLRKLSPAGEVSHEEALGGQAIREHAHHYNQLLEAYLAGPAAGADTLLDRARATLANLQAVREDYRMLDDDFQLPVLAARYLSSPDVPAERKRAFLLAPARQGGDDSRLRALLRNLAYVARAAEPYAREPVVGNLIGFARLEDGRWHSGSWRDSGAGYAQGRYAMDVNAIWVPEALRSVERMLASLRALGWSDADLEAAAPEVRGTPLAAWLADSAALRRAIDVWSGAERHFLVQLAPEQVRQRVRARLAALPAEERRFWERTWGDRAYPALRFLALALDADGQPIPVIHTDPATRLFISDWPSAESVLRDVRLMALDYPVGLRVAGLGPVVANDAYADPRVWAAFERDSYHGPRVVWGREVNLILLGLAERLAAAHDPSGDLRDPRLAPYVEQLREALRRTRDDVEASGFKYTSELWSYRIEDGRLLPTRYGIGSDVQLWSLTDLAVQYRLDRIGKREQGTGNR